MNEKCWIFVKHKKTGFRQNCDFREFIVTLIYIYIYIYIYQAD